MRVESIPGNPAGLAIRGCKSSSKDLELKLEDEQPGGALSLDTAKTYLITQNVIAVKVKIMTIVKALAPVTETVQSRMDVDIIWRKSKPSELGATLPRFAATFLGSGPSPATKFRA
mmetsp:Transcript_133356/g.324133  ORF Transcript_133356/g.324133 Transcript_133356/m.324133 type:complete len:116 (+) Transcript_133356:757-1104(+)